MNIILYLLQTIQYLYQQNCFLIQFICKYIPLKQWAFDDSHSPEYQKFKTDELPKIICHKQDWDWNDLLEYYAKRYNKVLKPVAHRKECDIPEDCHCPSCNAPMPYLYRNNGKKGQILCKVCQTAFSPEENRFQKQYPLKCPHCSHALVHKRKHDSHVMSLCLTMHVNLQLSLRKTAQALKDLYGIEISHQQVANYCKTAALVVKPFVDNYNYPKSSVFTADETYIKVRGIKGFIWFIMDAASRSIIGYRVSDNRGVGPCILAMRQAFLHLKELPKNFKFIADGYSAYPLAAQQFDLESKGKFKFDITQVIGLTNDDEVSKKHRPYKQMIELLNRTYKMSYRPTNGFDSYDGANFDLALWVAYYNFLRPHKHNKYQVLNKVEMLENASNMPAKWQMLIFLGQQTILQLQKAEQPNCS